MALGKFIKERVVTEEIDLDDMKKQIDSIKEKITFLQGIPDKQRLIEWREMVIEPRISVLQRLSAEFKAYTDK